MTNSNLSNIRYQITSCQSHKKCHRRSSHLQVQPRRRLGRPATKGMQREEVCQVIRVVRQQVPRGWNNVPVVGNVDLWCNGPDARHVLWEEGKKKEDL